MRYLIYLLSFLKRLQLKSAVFFALFPALCLTILCCLDFWMFPFVVAFIALLILATGRYLTKRDRLRETFVRCRICGFKHSALLYPARRKKKTPEVKGSFACSSFDHGHYPDIYYCPNCKNGFLKEMGTEQFEEVTREGMENYHQVEDHEYLSNIDARYLTNKKLIEKHHDLFAGKKVLEIGSYYGAFAHEAVKVVGSYTAIEPSLHACEYLKSKGEVYQVYNVGIEDLETHPDLKDQKFDTIVMLDVVEHLADPIAAMRSLHRHLAENGVVFFSTINMESVFSVALGPYWPWFMDMHYYYFSDRGLIDILHRSGYIQESHDHFPYYVHCSYFIKKLLSITFGVTTIPTWMEKMFKFPIPIKLGDTVLIKGRKV